jgi:hypothetical protein
VGSAFRLRERLAGIGGFVVGQYQARLAIVARTACRFNGNIGLETDGEGRSVRKLHVNLRAVARIFVDAADPNDFAGKFLAFDHGLTRLNRDDMGTVDSLHRIRQKSGDGARFRMAGEYHTHRV